MPKKRNQLKKLTVSTTIVEPTLAPQSKSIRSKKGKKIRSKVLKAILASARNGAKLGDDYWGETAVGASRTAWGETSGETPPPPPPWGETLGDWGETWGETQE